MKFMVSWQIHKDKRHEALKTFSEMTEDEIENEFGDLTLIGRWHDLSGLTGVAIFETDDPKLLMKWCLQWNGAVDFETVPVLEDKEARQLGAQVLS